MEVVFSTVTITIGALVFGLDVCVCSINRERNGTGLGMLSSPEKQTFLPPPPHPASVPLSFSASPWEMGLT